MSSTYLKFFKELLGSADAEAGTNIAGVSRDAFKGVRVWPLCGGGCRHFHWIGRATLIGLGFDEGPYDDHALQPASSQAVALAPQKNAFYLYEKAQSKIQGVAGDTQQRLKDMLAGKTAWDDHFAAQLLKQNHAALALFEQGQRMPGFQMPQAKTPKDSVEPPPPGFYSKFQPLVDLKRLQIAVLMRQGKEQQALQEIFGLLQVARHFRQPDLIALAISIGFQEKALDDLVALVQTSKLRPAVLQNTISRLEAYRLTPAPIVEALKLEYQHVPKAVLDAGRQGVREGSGNPEASGIFYYFLPNQTERVSAQYYEQLIAGLEAPYWQPKDVHIQSVEWWNVWMPNLLGRVTLDVSLPRFGDLSRNTLHSRNARLSLIQIWIALKCYKAEHGQWPSTLSALTPRYLPTVPIDTLTGKPFQYDLEAGTIYSAAKQAHESQLAISFKSEH